MKRRIVLLSTMVVLALTFAACGSNSGKGDPFKGAWHGTLDLTKQFNDGVIEYYPELKDHVEFEELVFALDITFEDGNMSMEVGADSVNTFMENFETGMEKIGKGALEDWLVTQDMTLEEVVAESGMDEDAYLADRYEQMGIVEMTQSMRRITNDSLVGLEKLVGPYTYDNKNLKLHFEDNSYETIAYEFDGDTLVLKIKGDGFTLRIDCEQ